MAMVQRACSGRCDVCTKRAQDEETGTAPMRTERAGSRWYGSFESVSQMDAARKVRSTARPDTALSNRRTEAHEHRNGVLRPSAVMTGNGSRLGSSVNVLVEMPSRGESAVYDD